MVPTITASGTSFKGAAAYYLHDKDADTRERIAWTHTENLVTNDPEKAWKVMAWTASHQAMLKANAGVRATGRKLEKPVFAFSIAWHPEQRPDKAHMLATAKAAAAAIGLAEHQAIYVSHNDEPQSHVHVLCNRVHPVTGKAATLSRSKEKLSAWALEYERTHGKVYCQARANNARSRSERQPRRDRNPVIQAAWQQSDTGRAFQAALAAQGFTLARGDRRSFVVVDRWGKTINPVRHLPDVRAAAFVHRLRDIDLNTLPTAISAQRSVRAQERKQYHASRKFDRWSAEYLNLNQNRQIEERAALNARYAKTLAEKKDALAQHYKVDALARSIDEVRERVERPALFRRFTGAAKRDRVMLEDLTLQLADVERRVAEQLGAITTERDFALADLGERHEREKHLAQDYLAERKPAFYAEEQATTQEQTGRGGGRSRDDDGGRERVHYRTPFITLLRSLPC
jgi:hypothetical protein